MKAEHTDIDNRLSDANCFIATIACHGQRFFCFEDRVAWIERSRTGHLFYHNEWNQKRIYVSRYGRWKHFHHGCTLHFVVARLVEFIKTGKRMRSSFFDAKHWAYGDEMNQVITVGLHLGILE